MCSKFRNRSYEKELLDGDNIPFSDIKVTLDELHIVNKLLGGYHTTMRGLHHLLNNLSGKRTIKIADVGCGGGDTLIRMAEWCSKNEIEAELVGIDIKKECIEYASLKTAGYPNISFITSDYRLVSDQFDIIHSSMFTHHLDDEQLNHYLSWAKNNTNLGVIVNDIHRHPLAYYSIKYITRLVSNSYLVKNDACLSVLRSFKANEWPVHAAKAGWKICDVHWNWAFRYTTVLTHE